MRLARRSLRPFRTRIPGIPPAAAIALHGNSWRLPVIPSGMVAECGVDILRLKEMALIKLSLCDSNFVFAYLLVTRPCYPSLFCPDTDRNNNSISTLRDQICIFHCVIMSWQKDDCGKFFSIQLDPRHNKLWQQICLGQLHPLDDLYLHLLPVIYVEHASPESENLN